MADDTAPCKRCGVRPRDSSLPSYCKQCKRELSKESYARTGGKRKLKDCSRCKGERTGSHPTYCPPCLAEWKAERARQCSRCGKPRETGEGTQFAYCPRCQRDVWMRRKYGISIDEFEALLAAQGDRCAICGGPENGRQWHVDHHHGSGRVRGVLCDNCNRGLGHFGDDPERLRAAAAYVER